MTESHTLIIGWHKSVRSDSGACVEVALAERAPAPAEQPGAAGSAEPSGSVERD
jgi:hypothetical protein